MTKPLYSPDFARELNEIKMRITNLELANYQEETSPNVANCIVKRTSDVSVLNGTNTLISYDTAISNDYSMWTVGQPTRITFKRSGIYVVSATAWYSSTATGRRILDIVLSGGTKLVARADNYVDSYGGQTVTALYRFESNEYIEARAYQASGSTQTISSAGDLSILFSAYYLES